MTAYLLRKLALAIPLLLVVSTVVFGMVHMIPGDPIDFIIGENAELSAQQELRRSYHLDKPVLINLRPWVSRDRVAELVARSGSREPDSPPTSAKEEEAWEELTDLGWWAVPHLLKTWKDPSSETAQARRARAALMEIARIEGRTDTPETADQSRDVDQALRGWFEEREEQVHPSLGGRLSALFLDTQYARFFADLFAGELRSIHSNQPVLQTLRTRFGYTMKLAGSALLVAMLVAIPVGTLAASRQYSWVDNLSMVGALVGISMPNFWLGPLLIIAFAIELGWFPVSGADSSSSIVLPAITLGLGMSAILTRITRSSVLDTVKQDYVRTARAKGLSPLRVLIRHALRTALIPVVTILGLQFGALLAGSIITEEIFGWPGLGRGIIDAINSRDFPMIQGCVLVIATTYVVVNTVTDFVYTLVNPQVRLD
ncbi:MAG: ABC transporter permease [Myxococcota bacterium]|nr:ABC transporter permease [Myxococcota bacterium]